MAKTKTTKYNISEHLRTPEEMAAYLEACIEEANGDAAFIAKALGDIARAKGMSQVTREAGLCRESLYKALSGERSPGFDTILKVIGALGLGEPGGGIQQVKEMRYVDRQGPKRGGFSLRSPLPRHPWVPSAERPCAPIDREVLILLY
jgi:probable addiction module antidote protein